MTYYKYKKKENKFTENGHTMFEVDVLKRLQRLAYLEDQLKQGQTLPIHDVSKRYAVTDIQLADWESVTIGDKKNNKVICHFITENGFDEAVKIANKINDFLNVC